VGGGSVRFASRVLDQFRTGVEKAIIVVGKGFLGCSANAALREKLKSGASNAIFERIMHSSV